MFWLGSIVKINIIFAENYFYCQHGSMCEKHIICIQCMIDYWHFYGTASSSPLLAVWSTYFYLHFNWHWISRLCTGTVFLLQSKLSSTGIIYIHWLYCQIQGHFQDKITISKTNRTIFKSNISRYARKSILYLFNVWSFIDI